MPIVEEIIDENFKVILWKENENDDLENFISHQEKLHPKKQKEKLIVKNILRMFYPNDELIYRENGEPFLHPSNRNISISHSLPFVAIAVSEEKIGIDLEKIQPKIQSVKSRFLYPTENWAENELELLTIIWSIKEALYKIHSAKYWSFRQHYEVDRFDIKEQKACCRIFNENSSDEYLASFRKIENFYLSIVQKKSLNK